MKEKITLLDGAVGTELWAKAEKNGWKKEPVWKYNIDHPEEEEKTAVRSTTHTSSGKSKGIVR